MPVRLPTRAPKKPGRDEEGGPSGTIGWRGVTVRVPDEWNPVAVSGEGEGGYLRVADPEGTTLEVKWEEPKGAVNLHQALERYLKKLRRTVRKAKGGGELQVKHRPRQLAGVRPREQTSLPYSWHVDGPDAKRASGVIWHCAECRRMVIAEVMGQSQEQISAAPAILKSITDHGREGWSTWGMYGLVVDVPETYRISGHQLMSGYLKFAFKRRSSTLQVERWGLANIVLKDVSLRDWYEGRERQRLSRYRYSVEETSQRGHPVLNLVGRERLLPAAAEAARCLSALSLPSLHFRAFVWQCPETNRILSVSGQERKPADVTGEVFQRLCCHQ